MLKLNSIIKKLKEKGFNYWFNEDGKVIAKGADAVETFHKALEKIQKKRGEYMGSSVASVQIMTDKKNPKKLLEVQVSVHKVIEVLKQVSIERRDKKYSFLSLYYDTDNVKNFKLSHIPKLAMIMINKCFKTSILGSYTYDDIKHLL